MKQRGVSIVICCHNGAERLPATIRHIAGQRVPPDIAWELLLVDNQSDDDSAQVAARIWRASGGDPGCFRVVAEARLGLSHARARAFQEAHYEYIVLCDDDNWLDDDYVKHACRLMDAHRAIGVLGGCGVLRCETEPPSHDLLCVFAAGPQASQNGPVPEQKVFGAGCVVRYSAWQRLQNTGFQSLLVDRKGHELHSGGDYELCLAIAIAGYAVWYDDRLRFTHYITRDRLTPAYFKRYATQSTEGFHVITSYKMIARGSRWAAYPWLFMMRNFAVTLRSFLVTKIRRLRSRRSGPEDYLRFYDRICTYKLVAYVSGFTTFVRTHRWIFEQARRCRAQEVYRPAAAGQRYGIFLRLFFASKPSEPLP